MHSNEKPALCELQQHEPGLNEDFLKVFLDRLPDHYFVRFEPAEQARHAASLSRLGPENPVELQLEFTDHQGLECTVLAFDHPSVFAIITGILASFGLNIVAGDIFTYTHETRSSPPRPNSPSRRPHRYQPRPRPDQAIHRRRIIDHFSCALENPEMPREKWQQQLVTRCREIFTLIEEQGPADSLYSARRAVNEMVAERLAALEQQAGPSLAPATIEVDNSAGPCTRLKVVSEDTPVFLYAFSNSLALQNLSIEHVKIRTIGNRIEDEIDIVDAGGGKITDEQRLNRIKLSALLTKHFTFFLGASPSPFDALCRFEQMLEEILRLPEQGKWTELLADPKILQDLARLLGTSDFMWEDFIRQQYESLLPMMKPQVHGRAFSRSRQELSAQLKQNLAKAASLEARKQVLNEFKDREIFMIDLDHILTPGVDFRDLAAALTALAEIVLDHGTDIVYDHLCGLYGIPRTYAGLVTQYAVLGLGKTGGAALGYASDIELLFVYSDSGGTDGDKKIDNAEFFNLMVQKMLWLIETKQEGIFNIDLRLRPYGNDGPLACSLESFCRYYGRNGPAHSFERLALVRMRRLVDDHGLGERLERIRDDIVYFSTSVDLAELRELRARQAAEKNEPGRVNAKFSPGALVDLEYDVQILQVMYGRDSEALRTPRLHQALEALAEAGVISDEEARQLRLAYDFLRRLINGLRMLRGSARDLFLPKIEADEFTHLARRMGYRRGEKLSAAQQLRLDFDTFTATVRTFVERHFGRDSLPGPASGNVADLILSDNVNHELARQVLEQACFRNPQRALVNLRRLCRDRESRETFARLALLACDLLRYQPDPDMALNNWEQFMAGETDRATFYKMLLAQPKRLEILLAVFSSSQFLADTLARDRQALQWLAQPRILHETRHRQDIEADLRIVSRQNQNNEEWFNQLRIARRKEILRIGVRDICLHLSTETIIAELAELAEAVVQTAWERVREQINEQYPQLREIGPESGFCILAYGKLGGSELNYSSDIDLLAIYRAPADDSTDRHLAGIYKQMMERTCTALSRHTEEGYAYRVDLRLRPYGRAGELVQNLNRLLAYYDREASTWELQALLKVRPVAGDLELGAEFIARAKRILTRPREAATIAASTRKLRNKSIKEQNNRIIRQGQDVKNGRGGIRDIEFMIQVRQLHLAPAHPELITGHTLTALQRLAELRAVSEAAARQLKTDYLFLRRVEHCLQIFEDRQVHALPTDQEELTALAKRLFGPSADHAKLLNEVRECMQRVDREYQSCINRLDNPSESS